MKDISKISKSFMCDCGTLNKFEFETDFDVHDIKMIVKCQKCGKERTIELMNFFVSHPTLIQRLPQPEKDNQVLNMADVPTISNAPNSISNDMFSEAVPFAANAVNIDDAENAGIANGMNMFESSYENGNEQQNQINSSLNSISESLDNNGNEDIINQIRSPQNNFAGLLDLHKLESEYKSNQNDSNQNNSNQNENNQNENIDDEIYEPFKENTSEQQNGIQMLNIGQNMVNVATQRRINEENEKEREDKETFSALFGIL